MVSWMAKVKNVIQCLKSTTTTTTIHVITDNSYSCGFSSSATSDDLCGQMTTLPTFLRSCILAIADAICAHINTYINTHTHTSCMHMAYIAS